MHGKRTGLSAAVLASAITIALTPVAASQGVKQIPGGVGTDPQPGATTKVEIQVHGLPGERVDVLVAYNPDRIEPLGAGRFSGAGNWKMAFDVPESLAQDGDTFLLIYSRAPIDATLCRGGACPPGSFKGGTRIDGAHNTDPDGDAACRLGRNGVIICKGQPRRVHLPADRQAAKELAEPHVLPTLQPAAQTESMWTGHLFGSTRGGAATDPFVSRSQAELFLGQLGSALRGSTVAFPLGGGSQRL